MADKQYMNVLVDVCSIVELVVESLECVINSPDDILSLMEGDAGIIDCIKHSGTNAFFQNIPPDLQSEIVGATGFILEAAKEAKFLEHGRKLKIENMLGRPNKITLASVRKMYEIGLTKFLFFIQIYFTQILNQNKSDIDGLSDKERNVVTRALECIKDFDILQEKENEYLDINIEDYLNVKFCTAEDDMAEEIAEARGEDEEFSAQIGSFGLDDIYVEG